jgi:hypothetical protein
MPCEDRTADLIRQALTAEADRAPDTGQILHTVLDAGEPHRRGRTLRMLPVAAAVVIAAAGIPIGIHALAPSPHAKTTPAAADVCGPGNVPATRAGSPPASLACYLPTNLPPGFFPEERTVTKIGPPPAGSHQEIAEWMNFSQSSPGGLLVLDAGRTPNLSPWRLDPQLPFHVSRVGQLRHVTVNGRPGTLEVAFFAATTGNNGSYYEDAVAWSPQPGVVLTLQLSGLPVDQASVVLDIANSVVRTDAPSPLPFQLPPLPKNTALAAESVSGTSPTEWMIDGAIDRDPSRRPARTMLSITWGLYYESETQPYLSDLAHKANATVQGVPAFLKAAPGSGFLVLKLGGLDLTVRYAGPISKAELLHIVNGTTFYPHVQYPWMGQH